MERNNFADRLRLCMQKKKQKNGRSSTSYSIANEIGISSSTIDNLLNAKVFPSVENSILLSRYFGVSLDWFLTGEYYEPCKLDQSEITIPRHVYDNLVSTQNSIENLVSIMQTHFGQANSGTK